MLLRGNKKHIGDTTNDLFIWAYRYVASALIESYAKIYKYFTPQIKISLKYTEILAFFVIFTP